MKKTKILFFAAIGVLISLLLLFVGIGSLFFVDIWMGIAVIMAVAFITILFIFNMPVYKKNDFFKESDIQCLRRLPKRVYPYVDSASSFSCGHAVIEMLLKSKGINLPQKRLIKLAGKKSMGMTPWEMRDILNKIFLKKKLNLEASILEYASYNELFNALYEGKDIIVLFMNHFYKEGYPMKANFLRFALLNKIVMSDKVGKSRAILTSPVYHPEGNFHYEPGLYPGEIVIPFEEFIQRFYPSCRLINAIKHKPTKTSCAFRNMKNKVWNFIFVIMMYIGYLSKILKPGCAIIVSQK